MSINQSLTQFPASGCALTAFEEYLVNEDRPDCPCWIIVKNSFAGMLDRDLLQAAYTYILQRHPLLRSVIRRRWDGRWVWRELPGWNPLVDWQELRGDSPWPVWRPIRLTERPGFHFIAVATESGADLFCQLHHAICDGKALRDILYDFLAFYSREKGRVLKPAPLDSAEFRNRNRFTNRPWQHLKMLPNHLVGLWVNWRFQRKIVAPLVPQAPAGASAEPYPAILSHTLSSDQFRQLRDAALRQKVSVNDLLVRDLFAAVGQWRTQRKLGAETDWIRLVIPVDMRKPTDRFLPAANLTSIVTLDRRMKSLANRKRLLARTHEEMNWVKHRDLRYTFWIVLGLQRLFPNGIARFANRGTCQGTLIFANHCQLFSRSPLLNSDRHLAVPGAVLKDLTMVSPLRPGTNAAVVVGNYAHALLIHLHYDSLVLSRKDAGELLQAFVEQINLSRDEKTGG